MVEKTLEIESGKILNKAHILCFSFGNYSCDTLVSLHNFATNVKF